MFAENRRVLSWAGVILLAACVSPVVAAPEACCFNPTGCLNLEPGDCVTAGGFGQGPGTNCTGVDCSSSGSCCAAGGGCGNGLSNFICTDSGGTYHGNGTSCQGAESTCNDGIDNDCDGNVDCADADCAASSSCLGACCNANGTCANGQTIATCAGAFQGIGTSCSGVSCPQPSGACCLTSGSCLDLTLDDCTVVPNSGWAGPFTICGGSFPAETGQLLCCDGYDNDCDGFTDVEDSNCAGITCVCPTENIDSCQTPANGAEPLLSDRFMNVRRADDFRPDNSVIHRTCFFPCFLGVDGTPSGFSCGGVGQTPPDSFIAKFYEDDMGRPGVLVPGVPVNGFMLTIDSQAPISEGAGSGLCWRYTAPINPPAGLTVTPGDCLWLEITGLGQGQPAGDCLVHWLSSQDGNNYSMRDVNNSYQVADFEKNDLAFCLDSGIIRASNPPTSQDGGCGNFPVACCQPGPQCLDGGTYTQCVGTNAAPVVGFPFPFVTCSQITCPLPANDACSTAPLKCFGDPSNPNLGVCSISEGPPNINEVCDQTIGGTASRDCASTSAVCGPLPSGSTGYRCQFSTDNRLATTDGPNTTNSGGNCFASGLNSFQADIWYKYTAPCNGALTIHSCGPNKTYDSMLQVFSTGTPTEVACPPTNNTQHVGPCSDDNCGTNSSGSATNFTVVNGASYLIRYGGYSQLGGVADASQNVSGLDIGVVCAHGEVAQTPGVAPSPHDRRKNRYISFTPNNGTSVVAFRVQKTTAPTGSCWVQTPITAFGSNNQFTATCGANPVFRVWNEPVIHVGDCEIIPVANYTIFTNVAGPIENPTGLVVSTILLPSGGKWWGDMVGSNNGSEWTPPNGITNVNDVTSLLAFISGVANRPHFTAANLQAISSNDSCLNAQVASSDVLIAVLAVAGGTYGPPSTTKITDPAQCALPPSANCPCCGN